MKLVNKHLGKSDREEIGKMQIERLEREIPKLKGEKREERMKAYRKLLSSSPDQPVYLIRS